MFGFLKAKFEKEAQAAIERRARQLAPAKAPRPAPPAVEKVAAAPAGPAATEPDARARAIAHMQAQVSDFVSPERQALLDNARRVHRAKQQILNELDDESRAKLVAMAITTLLNSAPIPSPPPKKR